MLSKWVNFYSKPFKRLNIALFFIAIVSTSLPTARGELRMQPVSGGTRGGVSLGGSTYYYFVTFPSSPSLVSPAFVDFLPRDISQTVENDTSLRHVFEFEVTTTLPINTGTGTTPVLVLRAFPNTGEGVNVSIASVNGQACNDTICQGRVARPLDGRVRYYAARFTSGQTLRIGFYPTEICKDPLPQSVLQGCNGTAPYVIEPAVGRQNTIKFSFSLFDVQNNSPETAPTGTPTDEMTTPQVANLGVDTPKFNCPSVPVLLNSYTPGDGQIFLDTNIFGLTSQTGTSPFVPASDLFVVGKVGNGVQPTLTSNFTAPGVNNLVANVGLGNSKTPVGGFTNATLYSLNFIMRDQAGVLAPADPGCLLSPVETASIQGFLNESSCFIATASFRSGDAPPVLMLRQFRDQVLLRHSFGEAFVNWYYSWSPQSAEWLMDHPFFRLPVLLFLAPIELFAWIMLHPACLLIPLGVLIGLGVCFFIRVLTKNDQVKSNAV